ncbi:hypothetical protein Q7P37_009496 [Cladosporium fusiforme]
MESPQPTLEGIPREIRDLIYNYVFGPSLVIKPRTSKASLGIAEYVCNYLPPPPPESLVHVSILPTCRSFYQEAVKILYESMIVRGTIPDFVLLLQITDFARHVEKVEIADCINSYKSQEFHQVLQRFRELWQQNVESIEFCEEANLGEVVCYDIGKYRLCDAGFSGIEFRNRRLLKMWPSIKNTPTDHGAYHKWLSPSEVLGSAINQRCFVLQSSFRCWVALHDLTVSMALSGQLSRMEHFHATGDLEKSEERRFIRLKLYTKSTRSYMIDADSLLVDGAMPSWSKSILSPRLRTLGPEHSSSSLTWATEYLSKNIAGCNLYVHDLRRTVLMRHRSHWAEADGGPDTIGYISQERSRAASGESSCLWIPDPLYPSGLISGHAARKWILNSSFSHLPGGQHDTTQLDRKTPREIRQLTYLAMAMEKPRNVRMFTLNAEYDDPNYTEWAHDLLRRYLVAAEMWAGADPGSAPSAFGLRHLRGFFYHNLDVARMGGTPPDAFIREKWDSDTADLYLPLVWNFHRVIPIPFRSRDEN